MPDTQTDTMHILLIPILIGIFSITILGAFITFLVDFFRELRYLNKEIQCSAGAERQYWMHQRRRLWLSLLPFIKY